jgi:hypothetical protein
MVEIMWLSAPMWSEIQMATQYIEFGRTMSMPIEKVREMRDQMMTNARRCKDGLEKERAALAKEARRLNRLLVQAVHDDYVAAY